MGSRTYNHLYHRVEYPRERSYRMEPYTLPNWMKITVTTEGNSKYLTVYSNIHVNKEVVIHPTYSADFSDQEIIKDLSGKVYNTFIK